MNEKKEVFEPAKIEIIVFDGDDIICESKVIEFPIID